jgi:hypothetical protein
MDDYYNETDEDPETGQKGDRAVRNPPLIARPNGRIA